MSKLATVAVDPPPMQTSASVDGRIVAAAVCAAVLGSSLTVLAVILRRRRCREQELPDSDASACSDCESFGDFGTLEHKDAVNEHPEVDELPKKTLRFTLPPKRSLSTLFIHLPAEPTPPLAFGINKSSKTRLSPTSMSYCLPPVTHRDSTSSISKAVFKAFNVNGTSSAVAGEDAIQRPRWSYWFNKFNIVDGQLGQTSFVGAPPTGPQGGSAPMCYPQSRGTLHNKSAAYPKVAQPESLSTLVEPVFASTLPLSLVKKPLHGPSKLGTHSASAKTTVDTPPIAYHTLMSSHYSPLTQMASSVQSGPQDIWSSPYENGSAGQLEVNRPRLVPNYSSNHTSVIVEISEASAELLKSQPP